MTIIHRVLPPDPILSLEAHLKRHGGRGLEVARQVEPEALIDELEASGLRGRGGAGFPTHIKWRKVRANASAEIPTTVAVNCAEGEPGTYKDRTLLMLDPYSVIEGALIAARAVDADRIVVALKRSFPEVVARVRDAVAEIVTAGWNDQVTIEVFEGPDEYLYGEETALLETIEGRYPFPRIAPPFRRGADDLFNGTGEQQSDSGQANRVEMVAPGETAAAPALVDNAETLANVPRIISRGGRWFRSEGTDASPGTIICTVSGSVRRAGVAEFVLGTPIRQVIDEVSGGPLPGRSVVAVLSGVSNGFIPADLLDTPLTYEDMEAIGSGLGSAGLVVYDDEDDLVAVAAGVSRFLAVESCGQCTPCKRDGLVLSGLLQRLALSDAGERELDQIRDRLRTIGDGARCYLATQHEVVVGSLLERFPEQVAAHISGAARRVGPAVVAEIVSIGEEGDVVIDERHREKQPDWSYDAEDSGQSPADRFDEHRAHLQLPE